MIFAIVYYISFIATLVEIVNALREFNLDRYLERKKQDIKKLEEIIKDSIYSPKFISGLFSIIVILKCILLTIILITSMIGFKSILNQML